MIKKNFFNHYNNLKIIIKIERLHCFPRDQKIRENESNHRDCRHEKEGDGYLH